MTAIQRIRQKIIDRSYYLSTHAEDEMVEDEFERVDVEHAILRGHIERRLILDVRGTRYRIEGPAKNGRRVHVICRFDENADLVIITVYAPEEI